ncbi:MAG: DUF4239 domain-containing protein [Candidatus Omnitrophota bacterium]|jgi:hypothetical protein
MPFTQLLLLKVPPLILAFIIVGLAVAFATAGLLIVRRFVPHNRLKIHHDVADPILGALGTIYAVVLAFVMVTVWIAFDKSSSNVRLEANYMSDIYRDAEAFAPDFRQKLGGLLRQYRKEVVDKEWPSMQKGEMNWEVEMTMRKIWDLYTTYQPKTTTEVAFFEESVSKLNLFRELRRQRLMDSRTGMPPLLWFVLLAGAFATISFTFLFGMESLKAQIAMVVLLSVMISLILFTIMSLDFPFTGSISVSSEPFKMVLLD